MMLLGGCQSFWSVSMSFLSVPVVLSLLMIGFLALFLQHSKSIVKIYLVSISTESIDSDLLDIKHSSHSKEKARGTLKEIPEIIVPNLEIIHNSCFPKNSKIVGVADRKVIEQVEASTFFLVRMCINSNVSTKGFINIYMKERQETKKQFSSF